MRRRAGHKLFLFAFIFLIILPCIAMSQGVQQTNQAGPYAIRTNVDLVVLRASVRDHKGAPVSGLAQEDFQVYEDKVPQQIESFSHEDVPVTVGLVIDNSGSMRPKHSDVIAAALAFARSSNPTIRYSWSISTSMFRWAFQRTRHSRTMRLNWKKRYPGMSSPA